MVKFYTRKGDEGFTGLLGEGQVPKYHPRPEAVGCLDECNAAIGIARAICLDSETAPILLQVQRDLYHVMAEVSATLENASRFRHIQSSNVSWLENQVDRLTQQVEIPREFIVPGDSLPGAQLDLARALVRRAERRLARLVHDGEVENKEILRYLNRLSSLLFILEFVENTKAGSSQPTLASDETGALP
jgi:cob(I)alamin adenosyltransferase